MRLQGHSLHGKPGGVLTLSLIARAMRINLCGRTTIIKPKNAQGAMNTYKVHIQREKIPADRQEPGGDPTLAHRENGQAVVVYLLAQLAALRRTGSNDTACDPCARVACRIGLVIIGFLVDHQSGTSFIEE